MQNLIRVSAQSLVIQPTNNGCYAPVQVDNSARENQLAQLFNAVNLQPERKQPESNMENLVDVFAGAFAQCRISVDFQQVEYHETEIAFVFVTYDNRR